MIETRPFIHDVSGNCVNYGVTNFTAENIYDALQSVGLEKHPSFSPEKLLLELHTEVLDRLWRNNLIDEKLKVNDKNIIVVQDFYFMGIPIKHSQKVPHNGPIFDTLIYYDGRLKCILRTREL